MLMRNKNMAEIIKNVKSIFIKGDFYQLGWM